VSTTPIPRISTLFTAKSTAHEVSEGVDLSGKRAIVTGGASGIGLETTRTLARLGAEVTVAARNVAAAEKAIAPLRAATEHDVRVAPLELTDAASVRAFTDAWNGPLHLLVNNAGVMAIQERALSPDGWETQLATNYLGHFRLTYALHDALARADGARVVALSSSAHLSSPVVFDDLDFRFRPYDPRQAYAQSKTAVNLFAVEATRRWANDGITVNAVNPGAIATPLQRHVGGKLVTPAELQKSPEQGASTTLLVATASVLDGIGGRYFNDNQEATVVDYRPATFAELVGGVATYSLDEGNADRLWNLTTPMLG
jgi:NAD(P)-dependent dehydrogenase (short-subunit alcohol dehydrogenase family)